MTYMIRRMQQDRTWSEWRICSQQEYVMAKGHMGTQTKVIAGGNDPLEGIQKHRGDPESPVCT